MFGGFFGRAFKGALAGGAIGGIAGGGDVGNMIGGAVGGAIGGGAGMFRGANYAGMLRKGTQLGRRATVGLERGAWAGFNKFGGTMGGNALGNISLGANRARSVLGTARTAIGNKATMVNEWGGKAAVAAGIGSGALIGSSIINSNRGY